MTERDYLLLDVFTDRLFGGNALAVFLGGEGVVPDAMQAIARELNLSETVFVLPGHGASHARLRIFTPGMELPFAGHPTIGAAIALVSEGGFLAGETDVVLAEEAGDVSVRIERRDGRLFATLTAPKLPTPIDLNLPMSTAAELLQLSLVDLGAPAPAAYSAGVPFLFVPVVAITRLNAVALDLPTWRAHVAQTNAPHVAAVTMDDWARGREVHMRMFAPLMGIAEDPATGAAAAALAGLLVDLQKPSDGVHRWIVHQGQAMGRPSVIELEADIAGGRPIAVRVGGTAIVVGRGTIQIE